MTRTRWPLAACVVLSTCARAPQSESPSRAPADADSSAELVVDDFDDGDLESELGLAWMVIADDLAGGGSQGRLESATTGSTRALRLIGERRAAEGYPMTYVGAWTTVDDDGRARDFSAYIGLRVRARATKGDGFKLAARRAGALDNFAAQIELDSAWKEIEIPFASLKALGTVGGKASKWSPTDLTWVGVYSAGPDASAVSVEIDRLSFYGASGAPPRASGAVKGSRLATVQLVDASPVAALPWHNLAREAAGDARTPRLPDAVALDWASDDGERVWFRISLAEAPPEGWMGVNVALDLDGDPKNGTRWWGSNSAFHFDELVTVYLTRAEPYWMGTVGVASAADIGRQVMDARTSDVAPAIDRANPAFLVGVPRTALPERGKIRLIATVGSSMVNSDDVPGTGAVELELPRRGAG